MKTTIFNIQNKDGKLILKTGRKIYAEISFNSNPDYKYVLWLKNSIALSGFETEQAAINRAEQLRTDWLNHLNSLTK